MHPANHSLLCQLILPTKIMNVTFLMRRRLIESGLLM
jgi:hypothetical protein